MQVLERYLGLLMDWLSANKLKQNPDKTEILQLGGPSYQLEEHLPDLDGFALPLKDHIRSLGVFLVPAHAGTNLCCGQECLLSILADCLAVPLPG